MSLIAKEKIKVNWTFTALIAGLLVSAFCVYAATPQQKVHVSPKVEVHGHRGARAVRPENTLPAFEYALGLDLDVLELDLGVTKDNALVIYHDQYINPQICRFKNGQPAQKKPIRNLTLKEIKQYDCGSLRNKKFSKQVLVPGAEIPTLKELFDLVQHSDAKKAKTIRFNIETKSDAKMPHLQPEPAEFAKLVYDALKTHGVIERAIVQSFDHRTLVEIKKLDPGIKTAALFDRRPKGDVVQAVKRIGADIVSPNFRWIKKKDVRRFQNANIQVVPWTVNRKKHWRKMLEMGVDGIITDDPAALIEFLKN